MNKMLIHEGSYAAELTYEEFDDGSPYAPLVREEDILKIDRVRMALRRGDVAAAAKEAKVYELTLLAGE